MRKFAHFGARPAGGFTLIELMVVVLVITILTMIAVPSYLSATLKSHRAEAKSVLLDLAARQERFMATNGAYSQVPTDMGYTGATWPQNVGSNYYSVSLTNFNPAAAGSATTAATPATFTFTATAINGQVKDTQCNTFSITQAGQQTSMNSAAATSTGCW
jgi:type IV pilus assembly protein PilE